MSESDILEIYYIPKPILLILIIIRVSTEFPPPYPTSAPGEACLFAEQVLERLPLFIFTT